MQSLSQIGNARREERVLLPALIELRSEHGDEALQADGLDVSPSGLSVRAAFVPEVGTRLLISFRCPPHDDAVRALAEVVWASWDGPRSGSFGMRFLELDTKSGTAIRRYAAADTVSVEQPIPARSAIMRIDGLDAPIDADVRLFDQSCIVLEQELSFLRLGRGIEVDVPGRGKERGRIASIELRQGPLDTPTLVFGVLLDEKRAEEPVTGQRAAAVPRERHSSVPAARQASVPPARSASATLEMPQSAIDELLHDPFSEQPQVSLSVAAAAQVGPSEKRKLDEPRVVRTRSTEPSPSLPSVMVDDDDDVERALQSRAPEALAMIGKASTAALAWLRLTLIPTLIAAGRKLTSRAQATEDGEPRTSQLLLNLARLRASIGSGYSRLSKSLRKRRTTAAAPRVQRSTISVRPQQQRPEPAPAARSRRWLTVGLAAFGVGLGVYALAPRSGADRIRVPRAEPAFAPAQATEPSVEPQEPPAVDSDAPAVSSLAPSQPGERQPDALAKPPAALEPADGAEPSAGSVRFGEPNVPNGRVFVLRMSGPVRSLEGEPREDGFSVRIPGRLALDRASPIATSHRAVARALILNRGEYAELTVEFLPGMRPKYQVVAKDSSLEITLERL